MIPKFATESDLCAAFIKYQTAQGFTAYAETAGFDILLVRDGIQWGVQAKLTLNTKVLCQLLPEFEEVGPDHRVILVPDSRGLGRLCTALGFNLQYPLHWGSTCTFGDLSACFDWNPVSRCPLPEYIPDVAAGVSGPVQLTKWKIGALRIVAHLFTHGGITRNDIKRLGCDPTRWCQHWLQPHHDRRGVYVIGSKMPRFDAQHPEVFAQIMAERRAT